MSAPAELPLRHLYETVHLGMGVADDQGRWVSSNPAVHRMLGYTEAELHALSIADVTHPDDRAGNWRLFQEVMGGRRSGDQMAKRYLRKDGSTLWAKLTVALAEEDGQRFALAVMEDLTEQRTASEAREQLLFARGERIKELGALHAAARLLSQQGLAPAELLQRLVKLLPPAFQFPQHASAALRLGSVEAVSEGHRDSPQQLVGSFVTAWGEPGELRVSYHDPPLAPGQPPFLAEEQPLLDSFAEMIRVEFDRRRAEDWVAEGHERLTLALAAAEMGVIDWDVVANRSHISSQVTAFVGLHGELDGPIGQFAQYIHPDDRVGLYQRVERLARSVASPDDPPFVQSEYRLARPEGGWRTISSVALAIRNEAGETKRILTVLGDVSLRREMEERVRQAQKMDALGMVAGSVAHDFNNVLTALISGSHVLLHDLPAGRPGHLLALELQEAGHRGAALTRQLLAFSRKSEFTPRLIDASAQVRAAGPLLQRLVGEGVELRLELGSDCSTRFDPGQLEQVLLNLVTNAREALGPRGRITIATRRVELGLAELEASVDAHPGPHLELSVTDDGPGMPPQTLARIYEPFFTTRPGQAAGLGLAVVFGVVRQNGGHVTVDSEVGRGTTFRVYLPTP